MVYKQKTLLTIDYNFLYLQWIHIVQYSATNNEDVELPYFVIDHHHCSHLLHSAHSLLFALCTIHSIENTDINIQYIYKI